MSHSPDTVRNGFASDPRWTSGLLALFAGVFIANGAMIYFANKEDASQVVSADAYELGLNYDRALDLAHQTRQTGWQLEATPCEGALCVRLSDGSGAPLENVSAVATLLRPSDSKLDRIVALGATGEPGLYRAPAALEPGLWELTVDVSRNAERARWTRRFIERP